LLMFWDISSFPELRHLPEEARKRLVRACIPRAVTTTLMARCVVFGAFLGALSAKAVVMWLRLRDADAMWAIGAAALLGIIGMYQWHLTRIRGQLIAYLEEVARHQRLPMCLACGYNLEGLTSAFCPECGSRLPPFRREESGRPGKPMVGKDAGLQ